MDARKIQQILNDSNDEAADEISMLRSALLVAKGALLQCSPCASLECQAVQRDWLDDAIAGCERALKAKAG